MEYSWDVCTLSLRTQSTLHSGVQEFSTALKENSFKVSTWHCRKAWAHAHRHMYTFSLTRSTHKHTHTTVFWRIYPCIQKINNSRKEKQVESQLIYLNHKRQELLMKCARSSVMNSLNLLSKDGTIQQETSALRELCIHHPQTALVKATDSGLPEPGR